MEQFSYDPVLRQEEIQPFRLFKPIQPPEHGTAMVLEPQRGDALLVRPGEPVPDARFGVYQRMSLVDTTEHRLAFAVTLVSRDPSFGFRAAVTLSCRVADPVAVVQRGIRDMAPHSGGRCAACCARSRAATTSPSSTRASRRSTRPSAPSTGTPPSGCAGSSWSSSSTRTRSPRAAAPTGTSSGSSGWTPWGAPTTSGSCGRRAPRR
ncbi:hypothetical protein HFP72_04975 [Nocardiopsis sp. ARC36]